MTNGFKIFLIYHFLETIFFSYFCTDKGLKLEKAKSKHFLMRIVIILQKDKLDNYFISIENKQILSGGIYLNSFKIK